MIEEAPGGKGKEEGRGGGMARQTNKRKDARRFSFLFFCITPTVLLSTFLYFNNAVDRPHIHIASDYI